MIIEPGHPLATRVFVNVDGVVSEHVVRVDTDARVATVEVCLRRPGRQTPVRVFSEHEPTRWDTRSGYERGLADVSVAELWVDASQKELDAVWPDVPEWVSRGRPPA